MEEFYQRKLPHWQPEGAEYFITFRLAGSLPRSAIHKLRTIREQLQNDQGLKGQSNLEEQIQRKVFHKYEQLLNENSTEVNWLRNKRVAQIVKEALHYRDTKEYDLYAYCIMPNHVHMVVQHLIKVSAESYPITRILQSLKRYTARECNKLLQRKGSFWQSESFDRVIRNNDELEKTISYVLNNPVKAELVGHWEEWPHNYCKPESVETFKSI